MKNIFGKTKSIAVKIINYIKVNTTQKLIGLAVISAVAVLLCAAAFACADIFKESHENIISSPSVNTENISDGTENGVNIIKRKPVSETEQKEAAKKDDDLSQYKNTHESAEEYTLKAETDDTVENIISEMTLDEKVYQMMFVTPEAISEEKCVIQASDALKNGLTAYPAGGIILFSDNLQDKSQVVNLNNQMQMSSKIPLFIGTDEEGGSVSRLGSNSALGTEKLPSAADIGKSGNPEIAYTYAVSAAHDLKSLGFNLNFAPVADVTDTSDSTIGDRAFSNKFETACPFVANFTAGLREENVVSVLKHFPGIGSCTADTHNGKSEINVTLDSLRKNEFITFKAGINAGADFVMISHTTAECAGDNLPSSLSKKVISEWLRDELNFNGIIITDSFSMKAVTNEYSSAQAAIKSVKAGTDMILMPYSLPEAHSAIVSAVKNGEITEDRITDSVRRILNVKKKRNILN